VRTSWQVGTCALGSEKSWSKAHRKSAPRTDTTSMAGELRLTTGRPGGTEEIKLQKYVKKLLEHPAFDADELRLRLPGPDKLHSRRGELQSPSSLAALTQLAAQTDELQIHMRAPISPPLSKKKRAPQREPARI